MGTGHAVSVELPPDLYERIQQAAERNERSVETIMLESLKVLFGTQPVDHEIGLDTYSDEQLWALVYRRLAWPQNERLRELSVRGKQTGLSAGEQAELEALIDQDDQLVLLRTRALMQLKQRGYDVERRFHLGA